MTTFRAEEDYVDHRRPSGVTFVRDLYEDLQRRDFTMNAIAMDTAYKLYDYFDGQQDINNRIIRTVGIAEERFQEDALRMIRCLGFSHNYHLILQRKHLKRCEHKWQILNFIN